MSLPGISFSWQINLGHMLVVFTAGIAAYVDLRRDVTEQMRGQAVLESQVGQLRDRMNNKDITIATLMTRFGSIEELIREVRNDLREFRRDVPPCRGSRERRAADRPRAVQPQSDFLKRPGPPAGRFAGAKGAREAADLMREALRRIQAGLEALGHAPGPVDGL